MRNNTQKNPLEEVLSFLAPTTTQDPQETAADSVQQQSRTADEAKEEREVQEPVNAEDELPGIVENVFAPGDVLALNSPAPFLVKDSLLSSEVLAAVLQDVEKTKQNNTLRAAGMGQQGSYWKNSLFRSDKMMWLSPEYCTEHGLQGIKQAVGQLAGASKQLKQFSNLGFILNGEISAQLAVYPANHTGYVRHLDSSSHQEGNSFKGQRIITMVLYLNEGWGTEDGGHLRAFLNPAHTINGCGYQDVIPLLGRVAMFRSDVVEHQVLPSVKERAAMTVWLYGYTNTIPQVPRDHAIASNVHVSNAIPLLECAGTDGRIFVSIVAYRDPECQHTLRDLFATAAAPKRVFVGVVWQGEPEDEDSCFAYPVPSAFNGQVRVMRIPSRDAAGPCWARHLAQSLWQGEDYFLQTDSHMRFRKGWDSYLCDQLERCEVLGSKAVLTCYPSGYKLPNDVSKDRRPTLLVPKVFGPDGMLRVLGKVLKDIPTTPVQSPLWAAGFSFSRSTLITEVPYDRFLTHIFFGEEVAMAARMFTHGYDFYTPPEMVAYHLWSRDYRPSFRQVQDESHEHAEAKSIQRIQNLLQGKVHDGYGLGTARSFAQFEASIKVSFSSSTIQPGAGDAGLPVSPFASNDNENKVDRMTEILQLINVRL